MGLHAGSSPIAIARSYAQTNSQLEILSGRLEPKGRAAPQEREREVDVARRAYQCVHLG